MKLKVLKNHRWHQCIKELKAKFGLGTLNFPETLILMSCLCKHKQDNVYFSW